MDKIKIGCVCKPVAGIIRDGSLEICKGQNILQSAKDWYEEQIADLIHPVSFEDCFVNIDGGAVSNKSAAFVDDVYVNADSKLCIIPLPVAERKGADIERDIKFLISCWFSLLDDESIDPWRREECVAIANKYQYTPQDYEAFLRSLS